MVRGERLRCSRSTCASRRSIATRSSSSGSATSTRCSSRTRDARRGVLDLTLTARNRGDAGRGPAVRRPGARGAAVRHAAARRRARRSRSASRSRTRRAAKRLVEREVVRVITPGTILEEESLDPGAPSLLAALAHDGGDAVRRSPPSTSPAAPSAPARSTAGLRPARSSSGSAPRELLLPATTCRATSPPRSPRPTAVGDGRAARADRRRRGAAAAGGARRRRRARRTSTRVYRRRPAHLRAPELYAPAGLLALDAATRRNLELAADARAASGAARSSGCSTRPRRRWARAGCASGCWRRCSTRRASASASTPSRRSSSDVDAARARSARRSHGIGDLERLAGRVGRARGGPARPGRARGGARPRRACAPRPWRRCARRCSRALAAALDPLPEVAAAIAATLVDAPPPHTRLPGYIRAGLPRRGRRAARERARRQGVARALRGATSAQRTGIASLKVRYNKVFGYYVEVTQAEPARWCPPDYERKQTLVGAERFVTPALKEHEARVLGAEERLRALEAAALRGAARRRRRAPSDARRAPRDALATLDVARGAGARSAHRRGCVAAARSTREPALRIRGGRHPVVEAVSGRAASCPTTRALDADDAQILVAHRARTWAASRPTCARSR